jgi:outer membrane protein assembly factor BamB
MQRTFILSLLVLFGVGSPTLADNWGHWRGPTGNGTSESAYPPIEWSDSKNVKWKVEIPGRGSGSPVVWEDKVFVVTAVSAADGPQAAANPPQNNPRSRERRRGRPGSGFGRGGPLPKLEFRLLCYNRNDGELLWENTSVVSQPHEGTHSTNGFASASPCTDGQHVYAHFGSRGLYCYTLDGELKWKRDDLGKMQTRNTFGEGSSPTLVDDMIIVPWDHEGPSYVTALNKLTGETIWKTDRDEPTNWSTPLVVEFEGRKQIILNGQNKVRSYDLETGEELWQCGGQTQRPCASAASDDGLVFVGSGFRGAFLGAFKLDGQGDIEGTDKVVWSVNRDTPDIASPLLSGDRLYFYKAKVGILSCFNAKTGTPYYTATRVPGLGSIYASPVAAGGFVYLTDREGTTVVIRDSETFEVVATNSVGETVDATPAPVDNELFLRGEKHLFCVSK